MSRKARIVESLVVVILAVGIAATVSVIEGWSAPSSDSDVIHVETLQVTDLSDDRKLVGLAHDVFLGVVVRERATTTDGPLPETQFDVRVLDPVKGTLSGTVVVNQAGGVDEAGVTVVVDDDELLQPGQSYLFATRTDDATGRHTLIPGYGNVRVDSAAVQTRLVERFTTAHATEQPSPLDH